MYVANISANAHLAAKGAAVKPLQKSNTDGSSVIYDTELEVVNYKKNCLMTKQKNIVI